MTDKDPVVASSEFDRSLAGSEVVRTLVSIAQTNQRLVRVALGSVAFDIVLSFIVGAVAWRAHDTADTAAKAANQSRINCIAANALNDKQQKLWAFVLSFPPPVEETAAQRKVREENTQRFRVYIAKAFRDRDCSAASLAGSADGTLPRPVHPGAHPGRTPAPTTSARTGAPGPVVSQPPTTREHGQRPADPPPRHRTASPTPTDSTRPTTTPTPSPSRTTIVCRLLPRTCDTSAGATTPRSGGPSTPRALGVTVTLLMTLLWVRLGLPKARRPARGVR